MDGNGRRRVRWTAAILGASAFFALAGVATARLSGESGSTDIAPGDNGTASAKCGSGSTAVAGGFSAPGFDPTADTGPANLTFASVLKGDRRWKVSGHNFNNPEPAAKATPGSGPLVAHVYCDKHDPGVTVESKSTTVDPGEHATLTPKCQGGREAVSGGHTSDPADPRGFTAYANASRRAGDQGWKVTFQNPDPQNAHDVTAFAYCEKNAPKLVQARGSDDVAPVENTATATAKCPKGTEIFSGGYKSTFTESGGAVGYALPFSSDRAKGDKWKVSAIGITVSTAPAALRRGTTTGIRETAIAYCTT